MGEVAECQVGGEEEGDVEYAGDDQGVETGRTLVPHALLSEGVFKWIGANDPRSVDTEEAGRSIRRNNGSDQSLDREVLLFVSVSKEVPC